MNASEAMTIVREIERGLARLGMREGADCSIENPVWRESFRTHETRMLFESVAAGSLRRLRGYLREVDKQESRMPDPDNPGTETQERR